MLLSNFLGQKVGSSLLFFYFCLSVLVAVPMVITEPVVAVVPLFLAMMLICLGAFNIELIKFFFTTTVKMPSKMLFSVLVLATSPVLSLLLRLRCVLPHNQTLRHLSLDLSMAEGLCETIPQLCLQLSIIMSRADRAPCPLQWIVICSSFLSLSYHELEYFSVKGKIKMSRLRTILTYLPLFISTTIFKLMTVALLIVFFNVYSFFFLIGFHLFYSFCARLYAVYRKISGAYFNIRIFVTVYVYNSEAFRPFNRFSRILIFFLYSSFLIVLLCVSQYHLEASVSFAGLEVVWQDIYLVNIAHVVIPVILVCGLVSVVLSRYQFSRWDMD